MPRDGATAQLSFLHYTDGCDLEEQQDPVVRPNAPTLTIGGSFTLICIAGFGPGPVQVVVTQSDGTSVTENLEGPGPDGFKYHADASVPAGPASITATQGSRTATGHLRVLLPPHAQIATLTPTVPRGGIARFVLASSFQEHVNLDVYLKKGHDYGFITSLPPLTTVGAGTTSYQLQTGRDDEPGSYALVVRRWGGLDPAFFELV